ncbi:MAG: TraB domain-containing protein [Candidatus Nanohalobium sp.]
MIKVYGTSHVSEESFDVIDEAFKEVDPDVVALELCPVRLEAMLREGETDSQGPMFMKILQKFQAYIGKKTGVMPGMEMLYAYEKAVDEEKDVILVDQDIRITVQNLMGTRRKERVKAVLALAAAFVLPGDSFDIAKIPEDRQITFMLQRFRERFPGIFDAIVEDRNRYMVEALTNYREEHPDQDIAVFVGAAHKGELKCDLE